MGKKVKVNILNQPFTFIGDDEDRIKKTASFVDEKIGSIMKDYGIINTMNAVIMAMMEITDDYLAIKKEAERLEGMTLNLLKKVEDCEVPCGARDKW